MQTNLNKVFQQARRECNPNVVDVLEEFMQTEAWCLDALKRDRELETYFLRWTKHNRPNQFNQARQTFRTVRAIANQRTLAKRQLFKTADDFFKKTNLNVPRRAAKDGYVSIDTFLPQDKKYEPLRALERLAHHNGRNFGYALIKAYHDSGKLVNEFMRDMALCNELMEQRPKQSKRLYNMCYDYINAYDKHIGHRLPEPNEEIQIGKFNDNLSIIMEYNAAINSAMRKYFGSNTQYPLQFDTYVVAPGAVKRFVISFSSLRKIAQYAKRCTRVAHVYSVWICTIWMADSLRTIIF